MPPAPGRPAGVVLLLLLASLTLAELTQIFVELHKTYTNLTSMSFRRRDSTRGIGGGNDLQQQCF